MVKKSKVYIKTFGCQMNEYDSEIMAGILTGDGYALTDDISEADVALLNTCSVRKHAEDKVWSELGRLSKIKEKKPITIGVCGCMAQKEGAGIIHRFPSVSLICGTHSIHQIGGLLNKAETAKGIVDIEERENLPFSHFPIKKNGGVATSLAVMRGCSRFCSYCVVPYLRGKEKSRGVEEIIDEVMHLTEQGFKEFLLLGQDITLYKSRSAASGEEIELPSLLKKINDIDGVERIRFVTSHPSGITSSLLKAVCELPKVCEHLHIPLQSGSDRILKLMNRGYTRDFYLSLTSKVKETIPGLSITTDLIVGFPGESDEEFEDTLDVVKKVGFDGAFMYKYSIRPGTRAAEMRDEIPENIKKERLRRLQEVQKEISLKKNEELIGRKVEVLVEGVKKKTPSKLFGRTRTNRVVTFKGEKGIIGKLVDITITEACQWELHGEIV